MSLGINYKRFSCLFSEGQSETLLLIAQFQVLCLVIIRHCCSVFRSIELCYFIFEVLITYPITYKCGVWTDVVQVISINLSNYYEKLLMNNIVCCRQEYKNINHSEIM